MESIFSSFEAFLLQNKLTVFLVLGIVFAFIIGRISGWTSDKSKRKNRKDAVEKSRAVLNGQFYEQIAPYLPGFPCDPSDAKFLGKPVDFVAFEGSGEGSEISEILFIEVKTGSSQLSSRERQIKKCIENGRVKYVEYRIEN